MMRRTLTGLALLSLGTLVAACSDPPPLYGNQASAASLAGQHPKGPPAPAVLPYPGGPYGNQVGDTINNIKAGGYRLSPAQTDSAQLTWDENITLEDFHNNSKLKCMLLSFGATWCGACRTEQGALPGDVASDPTFGVLNILIEGPQNGSNKVTKEDVDQWTQDFHQNYPVIYGGDSSGNSSAALKALWMGWDSGGSIGLPFNMVIRTTDMHVADVIQGFSQTIHDDAMAKCTDAP